MLNPMLINKYSSTEQRVGTWRNGKPLYRITIDFGQLPNNTLKTVSIPGGSGNFKIVKVDFDIINKNDESFQSYANKIPYYNPDSGKYVMCSYSEFVVRISTNANLSDHIASVDVYYWKKND